MDSPDQPPAPAATSDTYSPPVAKLLKIGRWSRPPSSYARIFGLGTEHVPELIRLATDRELFENGTVDEAFAVAHAWAVLAELRATEAIEPLVSFLNEFPDDDWVMDELPEAVAELGPGAIEPLRRAVLNDGWHFHARGSAASALELLGRRDSGARDACSEVLVEALARYAENPPELNTTLAHAAGMLHATAAGSHVEAAWRSGNMDFDWADPEELESEFGIELPLPPELDDIADTPPPIASVIRLRMPASPSRVKPQANSRKKMEKLARKKNRRRK